jgi:hypothetical protein
MSSRGWLPFYLLILEVLEYRFVDFSIALLDINGSLKNMQSWHSLGLGSERTPAVLGNVWLHWNVEDSLVFLEKLFSIGFRKQSDPGMRLVPRLLAVPV